jgi:uncharacterized protein with NAD-binding domain and iron-sulfur cluster
VKGLPCWPSEPLWDQVQGGEPPDDAAWDLESAWCLYEVGREPLARGTDFDVVVLAIPPAVLPIIGHDLLARSKPLADMVANVPSVATQSAQLWLKPDLAGLGWPWGPTVMTSYDEPFRSWGEMSHLLPRETWTGVVPQSLEYFCGTIVPPAMLPPFGVGDPNFVAEQTARVQDNFAEWAGRGIAQLFPNAVGPGGPGLDRRLVVSEFYRVNIDPSELYVQSPPRTIRYRLDAAGSGITNLYLAGDWTRTRVNAGCVEAAVESGRNCAEAICGHPIVPPPPRDA